MQHGVAVAPALEPFAGNGAAGDVAAEVPAVLVADDCATVTTYDRGTAVITAASPVSDQQLIVIGSMASFYCSTTALPR